MIKILFPPGCYGTYFGRSLYNYSNLRTLSYQSFEFDANGSSHAYRQDNEAQQHIRVGHIENISIEESDQIVVILPHQEHRLDYYNNQFVKEEKQQLIKYIQTQLSITDINLKLQDHWNYSSGFNQQVPRWMLREFFSYWIQNCLNSGYNQEKYSSISSIITTNTQEIFTNFLPILHKIANALNLEITVNSAEIQNIHHNFLQNQRYHNSQLRCNAWIHNVIETDLTEASPCQTIFDESYVQHVARTLGFEIRCDGLDVFPTTSNELRKVIYEIL